MMSTDTLEAGVVKVLTARYRSELEAALRRVGATAAEVFVSSQEESVVLGRSSACDRTFDDDGVSRRHALLRVRDGAWRVLDLDSTNGTWLNGSRVSRSTRVADGDELRLGRLRLRVRLPG